MDDIYEGYHAYQTYIAIKQHFTTKYDFFKYGGKVRINQQSFLKRKDKFFFKKLQRKYKGQDLVDYLVANFVIEGNLWVGNLKEKNWLEWKARMKSLSYNFKEDMRRVHDVNPDFNSLFNIDGTDHPFMFKMYLSDKISIETFIVLDQILNFSTVWDKTLSDDFIWKDKKNIINKYKSFINIDTKQFKQILRDMFE